MVDIEALQQRLGIALPEAYAWVLEEFGVPVTDTYKFLQPDDVCWYREHPRATDAPLEGGGVVLGEDHVGNALVFLSFPVAGIPALSDEIYLIRPGQKPEEVAMDFAGLVESLGIALVEEDRDSYQNAFKVAGVDDLAAAAADVLTARGYLHSEHGDEEGTHIFVSIFDNDTAVVHDPDSSWLWFGRRLAARTKRVTTGWEVIVAPEVEKNAEDEYEFPVTVRKVRIDRRGEMRDLEPGFDRAGANHGDPETTGRNVLWELLGAQSAAPLTLAFYMPPRPALSTRLSALLTAISESDAVDLAEIAGQQAVRIELPDGTRQLSVVTDEELATLREYTDSV